jgi:hypothetical protein
MRWFSYNYFVTGEDKQKEWVPSEQNSDGTLVDAHLAFTRKRCSSYVTGWICYEPPLYPPFNIPTYKIKMFWRIHAGESEMEH